MSIKKAVNTEFYKIIGGGQRVKQLHECGKTVIIYKDCNDWPSRAQVCGQDFFTGELWHIDLETVIEWAEEWAGVEEGILNYQIKDIEELYDTKITVLYKRK